MEPPVPVPIAVLVLVAALLLPLPLPAPRPLLTTLPLFAPLPLLVPVPLPLLVPAPLLTSLLLFAPLPLPVPVLLLITLAAFVPQLESLPVADQPVALVPPLLLEALSSTGALIRHLVRILLAIVSAVPAVLAVPANWPLLLLEQFLFSFSVTPSSMQDQLFPTFSYRIHVCLV